MTDPTNTANDWLNADPIRLEAWRAIASDVAKAASLMVTHDSSVLAGLACWMLACHLRVRYSTEPGVAGAADIEWYTVAQSLYSGMVS